MPLCSIWVWGPTTHHDNVVVCERRGKRDWRFIHGVFFSVIFYRSSQKKKDHVQRCLINTLWNRNAHTRMSASVRRNERRARRKEEGIDDGGRNVHMCFGNIFKLVSIYSRTDCHFECVQCVCACQRIFIRELVADERTICPEPMIEWNVRFVRKLSNIILIVLRMMISVCLETEIDSCSTYTIRISTWNNSLMPTDIIIYFGKL